MTGDPTPAAPYLLARPAPDDAPRLAELAGSTFRETYLEGNDPSAIEAYVATALSTEHYGRALAEGLEVEQVYLLAAHQGHGLGRTLPDVAFLGEHAFRLGNEEQHDLLMRRPVD